MKINIPNKIKGYIQAIVITLISVCYTLTMTGYSIGFPMINLWDLFVEQLFGSFILAVFFIALIYFVILMLGGISYYTVIIFLIFYSFAMAIGYGMPVITVIVALFGIAYLIYQGFKFMENR